MSAVSEESLERLVTMVNSSNLIALDKTITSLRRANESFSAAAARCSSVKERITRAVHEVGMCVTPEQRARIK